MYAVVKENHNHYSFTKFHDRVIEAQQEVERLARKERATFYVLKVIGKCYVEEQPVKWVDLTEKLEGEIGYERPKTY